MDNDQIIGRASSLHRALPSFVTHIYLLLQIPQAGLLAAAVRQGLSIPTDTATCVRGD